MKTKRTLTVSMGVLVLAGLVGCGDGNDGGATDALDAAAGGDAGSTSDTAQTADALPPIAIGPGYAPALALEPAGTAHIAWVGTEPTTTSLNFCRLPRGARACAASLKLTVPGTSLSRPFVSVSGTTVHVLSYRYGIEPGGTTGIFLVTSRDGGNSFEAARQVGTTDFSSAAQASDGSVSLSTHAVTKGLGFQTVSLADGAPAVTSEAVLSTTHLYTGTVGFPDGMTPLVVYADGDGDMQLRRWLGSGDRHDPATWSAPVDLGKGDRLRLAGGSKGLFLVAQVPTGDLHLRRYENNTFTAGSPIPDSMGEAAQSAFVQDSGGRLHLLWPRVEAAGFFLYHATSDDAGATWKRSTVTSDDAFTGVQVAIAPDRIGLAVWGTTGSGASSQVHAFAIGP